MSAHTPTPWRWCGNDIESADGIAEVMAPSVNCGPFCYGGMVELGISEADSSHIVKCVNNHDRLVEMLTALLAHPEDGMTRHMAHALLADLDAQGDDR